MSLVREYGYEYDAAPVASLLASTAGRVITEPQNGVWYLRSGRDALKMVAREHPDATVLMPALSCDSMTVPFSLYGLPIRYYRLTERYTVALESVEALIHGDEKELLFLYMDYFGNEALNDSQLLSLQSCYPTMVFVEDRTHNLLQPPMRTFQPDYVVASLRKWTNIPDGGMLRSEAPLQHTELGTALSFSQDRLKAQELRHRFFETGDLELKQQYRAIFSTVSEQMDIDPLPCGMSEYAFRLLQQVDWAAVGAQRKANATVLMDVLKDEPVRLIGAAPGQSDLYVAFLTEHRDEIQRRLSAVGVFCTVIWPLSEEKKAACPVAATTEACMLAAPCDQRYTEADMHVISNEMVRVLHE